MEKALIKFLKMLSKFLHADLNNETPCFEKLFVQGNMQHNLEEYSKMGTCQIYWVSLSTFDRLLYFTELA